MLTIRGIWGGMSDETAATILGEIRRGSPDVYREALAGTANALRMRLPALQKLPTARQAATIRRALTRMDLQEAGAHILIEWLTTHQRPMLSQLLDELGIAHEEGTVKDDVGPEPAAPRLKEAVERLYRSFPEEHVSVYLAAFSIITANDWPGLRPLIKLGPSPDAASSASPPEAQQPIPASREL